MKTQKFFNRMNALRFALILAIGIFVVSCSEKDEIVPMENRTTMESSIPDVLADFGKLSNEFNEFRPGPEGPELLPMSAQPTFNILNVALACTGLAGVVSRNQLTVFAPTDEAFAEIGLNNRNIASVPNLREILLYHVVAGRVYSSDLTSGPVTTFGGATFQVNANDFQITDNTGGVANIIAANIQGTNGVIHVIDKVILP